MDDFTISFPKPDYVKSTLLLTDARKILFEHSVLFEIRYATYDNSELSIEWTLNATNDEFNSYFTNKMVSIYTKKVLNSEKVQLLFDNTENINSCDFKIYINKVPFYVFLFDTEEEALIFEISNT